MSSRAQTSVVSRRGSADLLMLDVGNSKMQGVLVRGGVERWRWRVDYATANARWSRQARAGLVAARRLGGERVPVVVTSVVPRRADVVERQARALGWRRVRRLAATDTWPFHTDVEHPETLGVDRLANVAGLVALGLRNGIALDAGTAITIDVLERGVHRGGLILPGLGLWAAALHAHTAQLPRVVWNPQSAMIGADTRSALEAGMRFGVEGALRGIVGALRAGARGAVAIVFTGGDGARLHAACAFSETRFEPDLLYRGMRLVASARP